jgi:predicted phosphodiesterase
MRIAVLSDIHGNLPALKAVLADLAGRGADVVVNLGDILSGPLLPAETADFLMERDFTTIAGNHERQLLKARDTGKLDPASSDGYAAAQVSEAHVAWLRTLPPRHWLAVDVLLVHGTPTSDITYWMETVTPDHGQHSSLGMRAASAQEIEQRFAEGRQASLVLCGHTHVPRLAQVGATLVLNPGSVGLQAYQDTHPMYHQMQMGSPHARYALVERSSAGWVAQLCAVPYDWEPMQRLAARNGRADWAYALATGRLPAQDPTIAA